MIVNQLDLTKNQINSFDRFLLTSTSKALDALETMLALNIDSSDSSIEIARVVDVEKIAPLSREPLYVISSEMAGELQGNLYLFICSSDLKNLSEAIKPTFELLFLSSPDADLATLESQKPDWMNDDYKPHTDDSAFHEQMMDVLTEMANVLFGIYTKTIYAIYDLHTYHSLPESLRDTDRQHLQQILSSPKLLKKYHLVIMNEFSASHKPIKLWCLISPTRKSLKEILNRIG